MIQIRDIKKSFGTLEVLKGIDLDIEKGKIVSIVGPSGAGKTTLLQIMGTLDKADSGSVIIDGIDVMKLSDAKRSAFRNKHMGFVFQFHQLLPEFTALENVMMPALIGGTSRREAKKRAEELLAFMGLSDRASHKPNELSGGEKQRVAVARALVNKPDVVFADEPSGSLDTQNKQELHRLFFELRDKMGQTFVIVTHDEQLADLADRKISMQDGRITGPSAKDTQAVESDEKGRAEYTPDFIKTLDEDEVFVFGSNLAGMHGGGAAATAHRCFGAVWGQGVGLQGQSYAIPTMQGGTETIKPYVDEFIEFAKEHPELRFLVTKIGCGIAGFRNEDIAPLFREAVGIKNIVLPKDFVEIIKDKL
ncbi:MAG: ATP-binding cassette domain-containing protein [Bacteroidaceae bacterium]|nr:ATP-binding cassette domain-containing protein [Bacteroidaceae bacterium]